jgi:hypothetical protein
MLDRIEQIAEWVEIVRRDIAGRDNGTPADVSSGPPSEATLVSLFFDIKIPSIGLTRGGLTIARPVSLPNGRIPLREPPCPGWQVGEGVSPSLDARP